MSCIHCLIHTFSLFKRGSQGALCLCTAKVATNRPPYCQLLQFIFYLSRSFRVAFTLDFGNWVFLMHLKKKNKIITRKFYFLHRSSHSDDLLWWILFNWTLLLLLWKHLVWKFFVMKSGLRYVLSTPAGPRVGPSYTNVKTNIHALIASTPGRLKTVPDLEILVGYSTEVLPHGYVLETGRTLHIPQSKKRSHKIRWHYLSSKKTSLLLILNFLQRY